LSPSSRRLLARSNDKLKFVEHPGEDDAHYSCFAFEVLQSRNLALVAAVLPVCSHVFRICVRSDCTAWRAARKRDGFAADLALALFA
jgi:hypothetical protein